MKPRTACPSSAIGRDAFLYQDDIIFNLSPSREESSLNIGHDFLVSCFLETGVEAMTQSPQAKKHAFAAFDINGNMIGCGINRVATSDAASDAGYPWGAHHAEFDLFHNDFDCKDVAFFIGVRVNRFREFRCSIPCRQCAKRYGHHKSPVFALDWSGKIVRCNPNGKHEDICTFPGAQTQ